MPSVTGVVQAATNLTQAASAKAAKFGMVAKSGNMDILILCRFQDGFSRINL
jgi:hypothetical protein